MLVIDNEAVDVPTLKGPMRLHVFRPKDTSRKYGGIVFWSEIFQVTGPIRRCVGGTHARAQASASSRKPMASQ